MAAVCRVPPGSGNPAAVAQALGQYDERPCGPFQLCESYNSRVADGADGRRLAVWYTCASNDTAIALSAVFAALLLGLAWLAWHRAK
jgi:hypothetical protein